ncbi:MAG: hypothetical protein PHN49_04635 [Candidatus Omnitrophica bacterium]|nr:hypothetical protein [Candidatus Omnitrophota bacterium]
MLAFTFLFMVTAPWQTFGAEKPAISLKAEVDKAFITIGDPVVYTVTIRHVPSIKVLSQITPPASDILSIKKIEDLRREEDGMVVEGKRMKLTAYRLGEFILDPISIDYTDDKGQKGKIQTEKIYLTVKSVAEGETKTDIRGIKSVISIPRKYRLAIFVIITSLGVILLGLWIYRIVRKKVAERIEQGPPLTAEEEAKLNLERLYGSDLLKKGKLKEYYLRYSEIIRIYLEKRFKVLAVESTTYEIVRFLKQNQVDQSLLEKIDEVLEASDLAKFAKWRPEVFQILDLNKKALQVIDEAKPKETQGGV